MDNGPFGTAPDGRAVELFHLRDGIEVSIATYGGVVVSCRVPDREGRMADVVLGHDRLEGYVQDSAYLGALIGRYANRIARGRFALDGRTYQLAVNNGPNSLHGGDAGFNKAVWDAAAVDDRALRLLLTSPSGMGGYPGTLHVEVTYTVQDRDLRIDYAAHTESPTVINLTHHAYFNLAGVEGPALAPVLGHELQIRAERYTPVDAALIPTGTLLAVADTPFDFRRSTPIGARIHARDPQLEVAGGYDHNWAVDSRGLRTAARVHEPGSGRVLEVLTTQPGMQFYSGNFLDGTIRGKHGVAYAHRTGFCLETQHYPDSPNQPQFPSTVLRPAETYQHTTIYRFSTQ